MANLIRVPKSGNDWTRNELAAYHIAVESQTKEQFFGSADLPLPHQPSLVGLMTTEDRQQAPNVETMKLLHYLDLALSPKVGQELAVDNFTVKLLEKIGYDEDDLIIFARRTLPFVNCGVTSLAQTDVCVMDDYEQLLLLVQGDKRLLDLKDPEPQVIAEAIAAYALNNKIMENLNLSPRLAITFPAITMIGTSPIFYRIAVTAELSTAVQQGTYPKAETRVFRFIPVLPRRQSPDMRPLENRAEILACLEAFKQFL